jgi:hypothetical protein
VAKTVQRITNLEKETDKIKANINEFEIETSRQFKEEQDRLMCAKPNPEDWSEHLENDPDFQEEIDNIINNPKVPEAHEDFTPAVFDDVCVNMEMATPRDRDGDGPDFAKVMKCLRDKTWTADRQGQQQCDPGHEGMQVKHKDGHKALLGANESAENVFAQVDNKGNQHVLFKATAGHRTDGSAAKQQHAFNTTRSGAQRRRATTKGREILVQWKDGSTTWVTLEDMKNSHQIQFAEHATQRRVAGDTAFAWWTQHVLNKCCRIIGKIKAKCWVRIHKFGVKIPKTVEEAKRFDAENGNALWFCFHTACK